MDRTPRVRTSPRRHHATGHRARAAGQSRLAALDSTPVRTSDVLYSVPIESGLFLRFRLSLLQFPCGVPVVLKVSRCELYNLRCRSADGARIETARKPRGGQAPTLLQSISRSRRTRRRGANSVGDELRAETGGTAFATWVVPRLFPIKRLTLGTRSQAKEIYFAPLHLHACRAMKHIPEATPAPGTPISRLAVVML